MYVGIDWAEAAHAVCLLDEAGCLLAEQTIPDTIEGSRELHRLLAEHATAPREVVIASETEHGLLMRALRQSDYQLYAINPLLASRYRERTTASGAKSDPGDARMLADLVRLDRHHHRPIAGDSTAVQALRVLTRAHQGLIWSRQQQTNQLRSALRQYYPGALAAFRTLDAPEALAVLDRAPTPAQGRRLTATQLAAVLRRAGRQRRITERAAAIRDILRQPVLEQPDALATAYGHQVTALVRVITALSAQITALEAQLTQEYRCHPDAEIISSLPGLGVVLGARVLAEFGDDPTRYPDSRARKCYAGTAPVTRTSGKSRTVSRRRAANTHLQNACFLWATSAKLSSAGAHDHYWQRRDRDKGHAPSVRALANRLVGILDGCLRHRTRYDEARAWPQLTVLTPDNEPPGHQTKSCKMTGTQGGSKVSIAAHA